MTTTVKHSVFITWTPLEQRLPPPGEIVLLTDGYRFEIGVLDETLSYWHLRRRETKNLTECLKLDPKQKGQVIYTHWAYPPKLPGENRRFVESQVIKVSGSRVLAD